VNVRPVRHHVTELHRDLTVVLDADEPDAYQAAFEAGYPFPANLSFLARNADGIERLVDVGANIGQVTLVAAALGLDCLAIEPDPKSYLLLCEALAQNGFTNVRPVHAAASNASAVLTLRGSSAWSHVIEESETGGPGVSVPALPLDTLLPLYGFESPDLVKIDVEGHEPSVIQGLQDTIRRCGPLIVVESNTWMLGGPGPARLLLESIEALGYALYLFMPDGTAAGRPSDAMQPLAVADYLAVPKAAPDGRALPSLRTLPLDEEVELVHQELLSLAGEPADLRPRLLHLTHSIPDLERRVGTSGTRQLKKRVARLATDPAVESLRRESWAPPHWAASG
jgi:FkbM family methyltransferase